MKVHRMKTKCTECYYVVNFGGVDNHPKMCLKCGTDRNKYKDIRVIDADGEELKNMTNYRQIYEN